MKLKNAILSVLYMYRFLCAPKDMVRCFLVVVIFLRSRETPVKMRKIWDKHDDILLVLTIIALWATKKDAMLSVYIMWGVCNNSTLA